jgi:hypothetical protein
MSNMPAPSPRQLMSKIAAKVISENQAVWLELKAEIANGGSPDTYGSPIGLSFQGPIEKIMSGLSDEERETLASYASKLLPPDAPDQCCSGLVVGEVIARAARVVSRHGFYQ